MTEKPILFNSVDVRAILEGRKTMTRRVIRPQPIYHIHSGALAFADQHCHPFYKSKRGIISPYGQPGDRLWVRETSHAVTRPELYRGRRVFYRADNDSPADLWPLKWTPSIHMPRWASRINLEITAVRVERLQDISEEDAIAEGISCIGCTTCDDDGYQNYWRDYSHPLKDGGWAYSISDPVTSFSTLWNSTAKSGEKWDDNPYVWVYEFKVVK